VPHDPKSDVFQLQLSQYHSLDLVRLAKSRKYRVVFAERFGVQRRAFVEITFEEALALAKFLANIEDGMRGTDPFDPPTDPGRPAVMPPHEVSEMLKDYLDQEAGVDLSIHPPDSGTNAPSQEEARRESVPTRSAERPEQGTSEALGLLGLRPGEALSDDTRGDAKAHPEGPGPDRPGSAARERLGRADTQFIGSAVKPRPKK
jgi:hypothetical protein